MSRPKIRPCLGGGSSTRLFLGWAIVCLVVGAAIRNDIFLELMLSTVWLLVAAPLALWWYVGRFR